MSVCSLTNKDATYWCHQMAYDTADEASWYAIICTALITSKRESESGVFNLLCCFTPCNGTKALFAFHPCLIVCKQTSAIAKDYLTTRPSPELRVLTADQHAVSRAELTALRDMLASSAVNDPSVLQLPHNFHLPSGGALRRAPGERCQLHRSAK